MNLGGSRLLDRKSRNILESIWTGYTWIGTKKRWNKSMAKRIFTTIARAMGQQNRSEVYNLNFNWHWLALKPHMFLISLPINKNNSKIVFHVKEPGATCPSITLLQYHMPSTWSYSWLPTKTTTTCFPGQTAHCYNMFFVITCYPKQQLQNGFTAEPYKPIRSLQEVTLLQNGSTGYIFETRFYW